MARPTWLLVPLLAVPLLLQAQTAPEFEIGYRSLHLTGSRDVYRSQINERSGVLLHSFRYDSTGTPFTDRFHIDASDLGVGPAGALRLEAGKSGTYRFTLGYRRSDAFSAIPTYALGQHNFDRKRNALDVELELLRWSKFTPFIGYTWNRYDGPGTTTYHTGQDEFVLQQQLRDTDHEFRLGTGFDFGPVQGSLTQGWRRFQGNETLTLAPGAGGGNNSGPVLGQPVTITNLTGSDHTKVKTPFTNFYITGMAASRVRLVGEYVRFAADSRDNGNEQLTGTLASFALSRFYTGETEQDSSRAHNTTWRGGARAEVELFHGVDLLAGWHHESRELSGTALINTLFLQSITFGGADPRDVQEVLNSSNSLDRKEDVGSVGLSARSLGPFSFRAGYSLSKQDVTVTPDLSEIVVSSAGGQGGTFSRRVNNFDADGAFSNHGFTLGAAWKRSNANDPILRTDFLHRDRVRLRAGWQAKRFFRAGVTADDTRQTNDRADIGYKAKVRDYTGDIEVMPTEMISLRGSASRFRSNSNILFRHPENFTIDDSIHIERGKAIQGGLSLFFTRFSLDGDVSRFTNEGSLPFTIHRARARVTVPLVARFGVAGEWARDKYSETAFQLSNFAGSRYGLYLRFTP